MKKTFTALFPILSPMIVFYVFFLISLIQYSSHSSPPGVYYGREGKELAEYREVLRLLNWHFIGVVLYSLPVLHRRNVPVE